MYNSMSMRTHASISRLLIAATLCAAVVGALSAQMPQPELTLISKDRVFPLAGAGVRGIKGGPDGRYYVLTAHAVILFLADGTKVGEVPAPPTNGGKADPLNSAEAFDVGRDGRIYVADHGANTLRVFSPAGAPLLNIEFDSPTGIVALSGDEFAASSSTAENLISVYDLKGAEIRAFCNSVDLATTPQINQYLSIARLATDSASNIYLAYTYFPEPTVRKYDRSGYATSEIVLNTVDFAPAAQAIRREIKRLDPKGNPLHLDHQRISAIGVDPEAQSVWLITGDELLRFDRDGKFQMRYTLYLPDGSHCDPNSIFVEHDRLLISTDSQGVYEFSRPDR